MEDESSPVMSESAMPLPPESVFSTREELAEYLKEWSATFNYGFRICRTRQKSPTRKVVIYECDRAGSPPSIDGPKERIRRVSSRKTQCKFSIKAVETATGSWEIRHRPDPQFAVHNHLPSLAAAAHYQHRRFDTDEKDIARQLFDAGKGILIIELNNLLIEIGITPAKAMTYFRQNSEKQFLPYDFYNLYASLRRDIRRGLSSTDALIEDLKERGIYQKIKPTGNTTEYLWIALPQSIELGLKNQDVILIDSTYKTNKFGLPLLHLIGKQILII
jgi:hypothetical protein